MNHVNNTKAKNYYYEYEKNKLIKLDIMHWNANIINNKQLEFEKFIFNDLSPDIISLNETKVSEFRAKSC